MSSAPAELFTSKDEQKQIASCMREMGWDAEFDDTDGSITTAVAPDQDAAYERDMTACMEEIGIDTSGELDEAKLDTAYEWYTAIADCLEEHGYSVPERPTRQTFGSTYETSPWIPWAEVKGTKMGEARKDCPVLNH